MVKRPSKLQQISNYKSELVLLFAIILGSVLRLWRINDLPYPPNDSELFFGYYGWSLLHFGVDEFGTKFPINFPSIGDFKYPRLAYLNIIPAAIFGLSFITARFWSVLTGIILIPVVFVFSLMVFKNKIAAAASALLIALSPWSIILSRIGYENHIALVFTTLGLVLLLGPYLNNEFLVKHKKISLILSFVLLVLSTFTYAAERIFVPLILLFLFLIYGFNKLEKAKGVIAAFLISITLIVVASLIPWQNRGRSSSLIYNNMSASETNRQQELIQESGLSPMRTPVFLTRLMVNKYRIMGFHFLDKYLGHFSPKFLFIEGDVSYERIPDTGQILLIEIFLLPLGLMMMFKKKLLPLSLIILFWLVIAPIPSSLTTGAVVNRASLMIVPLAMISGLGLSYLFSVKFKYKLILIIAAISGLIFSSVYSIYQIFVIKPIHQAWYTEVVNQQMVEDILSIKNDYKAVVVPKDEYIFFLYYGKISPNEFLSDSDILPLDRQNPWDRVNRYSNIYFKMNRNCPTSGKENVLYICKGEDVPQNSRIVKVYSYRDGVPAYTLLTFYPISKMPNPLPVLPARIKYMVDLESSVDRKDGLIGKDSQEWW